MDNKSKAIKSFREIPGVGKVVAEDLWNLGYQSIDDLAGLDPDEIYIRHNDYRGNVQDICMLYTFRCAVYFAETYGKRQEPDKLKWWNWMDAVKLSSEEKDKQIRDKFKSR